MLWTRHTSLLKAFLEETYEQKPARCSSKRAHLLRPGLTIEDFANDIANLIEAEELQQVILVGHSFAGVPISVSR
jgi:pimeloyl-ACP methyl ester carboxylesterase